MQDKIDQDSKELVSDTIRKKFSYFGLRVLPWVLMVILIGLN